MALAEAMLITPLLRLNSVCDALAALLPESVSVPAPSLPSLAPPLSAFCSAPEIVVSPAPPTVRIFDELR